MERDRGLYDADAMQERVRITDVSPRDGLQNEPGVIPAADKVRLIEALLRTGVDEVEATSFVSAKWVPQLGDAEEVLGAIRDRARRCVVSALVPNEKGFERALAFHSAAAPLKIAVFTAASETFSRRNTNASITETIERFGAFLPRAFEAGMAVRMYISCAVACPFEGPIAPEAVRGVADRLLALAPAWPLEERDEHGWPRVEIDLGDTIGAARPEDIDSLLGMFSTEERSHRLALHLHDTFGRAGACIRRGLELGVRSFDGAVAGLGGCPYASTKEKPAPGNVSTETLIATVHEAGFATGVDPARLAEAAAVAREVTRRARATAAP